MPRDCVGRGDAAPVIDDRLLHPFQVHGIVHMTHVVDVGRFDRDGVAEHGPSNQKRVDALIR